MIQKNLFLLEYMVINRIEKDTLRLEAIRCVGRLLNKSDIGNMAQDHKVKPLEKLVAVKGKPLSFFETELIEEIFKLNPIHRD